MPAHTTAFTVRKNQLADVRLHTSPAEPLTVGHVRIAVESIALTTNNITYANFGNTMGYWQFFPTGEADWGCIPAWGFGVVSESLCDGVAVGEKIYGYFPMASHVVLQPVRVRAGGFVDGASHRQALHVVYNQYMRCSADPFYTPGSEAIQALLRPLFITSFLVDDFLADNDFFGASTAEPAGTTLLVSSASSKTAYGTAFQLAQRPGARVVALTSPGNVAFCESLGCYGRVLRYDQLAELPAELPCVYVDFSGSASLRHAIHSRFTQLKYSCSIGGTHAADLTPGKADPTSGAAVYPPGPRATLFFAPAQIKKRGADWGPQGLEARLQVAWKAFTDRVTATGSHEQAWLVTQTHQGMQSIEAVYGDVLAGGDPRLGHTVTL